MDILGCFRRGETMSRPVGLPDTGSIEAFLLEHLHDDEVVLTDRSDELVFRAIDGVDLFSRLSELGIDLPSLYAELRRRAVSDAAPDAERADWEDGYDAIGLSPGEIAMRQRAKSAAKAARTVADVIEVLDGTYFEAAFVSEDQTRAWGYFDPSDLSAAVEEPVDPHARRATDRRVRLDPRARVRHEGSGEDIHVFVLLDPPEE